MRNTILFLLLCWAVAGFSQSSQSPTIVDFLGASLPSPWSGSDSALCKGSALTIHGANFLSTNNGEVFDSLSVSLGGFPALVASVTSGNFGNDDTTTTILPDVFRNDTTVMLTLTKHTHLWSLPYQYHDSIPVRLVGDWVRVDYPGSLFCLGDSNPVPTIELGSTTNGLFSGWPGADPVTGEIALHSGNTGIHSFQWQGGHPVCADTVDIQVQVNPMVPAVALLAGTTSVELCVNIGMAEPDSSSLFPQGGTFSSPSMIVLDSLQGLVNANASPVGMHQLVYSAPGCFTPATIDIEIIPPASATVIYPIPLQNGVQHLCAGDDLVAPVFLSGSAGGSFYSIPQGVSFRSGGVIDPAFSIPGTYDVFYVPPGSCVDTSGAAYSLEIDTVTHAGFSMPTGPYCEDDTIQLGFIQNGGVSSFSLLNSNGVVWGPGNGEIPLQGIAPGPYQLQQSTAAACPDTLTESFVLSPFGDPTFSYPPNNVFCLGDPNPYPVVTGTTGGIFTAVNAQTVLGPGGSIDLQASGAGPHEIRYTTPGDCPADTVVTVTIYTTAQATFSFTSSTFCTNEQNPVPNLSGTPGGVFTADSGLVVHPDSGTIDLSASLPGTYNVTYSLSGGCQSSYSQTVSILEADTISSFVYPTPICSNGDNPVPLLLGDSLGTFSGSAGLVLSNPVLGVIDLELTPPGTYSVFFDLDNACAADPVDTLVILPADNPDFEYMSSVWCQNQSNPIPAIALPGGFFSDTSGHLFFSDPNTGEIDLLASDSGGPYLVSYTTAGTCPETSSELVSILPRPAGTTVAASPGWTVCEGVQAGFQASSTDAVNYWWGVNDSAVNGLYDLYLTQQLKDGDTVCVVAYNAHGCSDTVQETVRILPAPTVELFAPSVVVGDGQIEVEMLVEVDNTRLSLEVIPDQVRVDAASYATAPLDSGQIWRGRIGVYVDQLATDPGKLLLVASPEANGCSGPDDTLLVLVNPEEQNFWIPEVFTPNGDGVNDRFEVLVKSGLDPYDFEIQIFNRGGGMVKRVHPVSSGWDGGNSPDGVYWWLLKDLKREKVLLEGGLTLRRR